MFNTNKNFLMKEMIFKHLSIFITTQLVMKNAQYKIMKIINYRKKKAYFLNLRKNIF